MALAPDVTVHIDELVLEGVASHEGPVLAEAIRRAVADQLVARGLPEAWSRGGVIDALDLGHVAAGAPGQLGRSVGEAIVRGGGR